MSRRVQWFNALPLELRARLIDLDGQAGERCVAAEQGLGPRVSRELPGRWRWMLAGGTMVPLGGVAVLFGLARWGRGAVLWGSWGGPLWVLGGAMVLAGLGALWWGRRSVEQLELPFRHGTLLTADCMVSLGEMVRIEELNPQGPWLEEKTIKVQRWSQSRKRLLEREALCWVLQAGSLQVGFPRRDEANRVLAEHHRLRQAAHADAARGAPWPSLFQGWPEDGLQTTAPAPPSQGPAVRVHRASAASPWRVGLALLLWVGFGGLLVVTRGVLREQEARDDILSGAPLGDCALYEQRGGFLYRTTLRSACVPELLRRARYQADDGRGDEAHKTLEQLEWFDPKAMRDEPVRQLRARIAPCRGKGGRCP
jgi:hypothetical protein